MSSLRSKIDFRQLFGLQEDQKAYFPALTGVRGIAALMVYVHHFNPFEKNSLAYNLANELHIGVTLFFVLSGFLIAYRYFDAHDFDFRNYMLNRFARIYPMFFILTSLHFLYFGDTRFWRYLLNISFLKGFFDFFKFSGIAQSWSLTVEESFYVLAPFCFLLIRKHWIFLLLLPLLGMLIGVFLVSFFSEHIYYGFFYSYKFMFNYTFFGRCSEFFVGVGLALFYKKCNYQFPFQIFSYFGLVSLFFCVLFLSKNMFYASRQLIDRFFVPFLGIAPFYFGLLREKTLFSAFLGSQAMQVLGKSSYIFYLIHMGFIQYFISIYTNNMLFQFLMLLFLSVFMFLYIEEPLNTFFRRKFYFSKN